MADVMGETTSCPDKAAAWFGRDCTYNVKSRYTSGAWRPYDLWSAYYKWVANANYIIAAEETMEGLPSDVNYVIGAGYVIRAYSYFMLIQSFARTYKGHESGGCSLVHGTQRCRNRRAATRHGAAGIRPDRG